MTDKPVIKIGNIVSEIHGLPGHAVDMLDHELSYVVPGAFFVMQSRNFGQWDGRKRLVKKPRNKNYIQINTGLVGKTIKLLFDNYKIVVDIEDIRVKPERTLDYKWNETLFNLRDYQIEAIDNCIKKSRGVIEVATGGGKTIIAANLIQRIGVSPFIFYVMTKDLLYQAKNRLEQAIKGLEVGIVGDGQCDIREVNVVTVQTATKVYGKDARKDLSDIMKKCDFDDASLYYMKQEDLSHVESDERKKGIKNLIESAKGIYFDEAHHCPAATAKVILEKSKNAYYLFGGSATPMRADNADLLIEGLFGRKSADINASFLIKKGHLMKPYIYYIKMKNKIQKIANFEDDIKTNIINNEERNNHIVNIANVLSEDNLSVLILVARIEHGKMLKDMIPGSEFIYGQTSTAKREEILVELEQKKRKILISSTIADEGLDIPTLNCVILAGGGKSPTKCKQRVGRAIRKASGKEISLIFDFMDIGKYTRKHASARKNMLKKEPEFVVIETDEFSNTKRPRLTSKPLF